MSLKVHLSRKETQQFLRFCVVGGICWLIDVGVFWLMSEQVNANYQMAQITSYLVSLCVNYLLTIYWTFHTESSMLNLVGIVGAHMFNLTLRSGLMWLFMEHPFFTPVYDDCASLFASLGIVCSRRYMALIPTTIICAFTNYLVIRTVVKYSKRKTVAKAKE
jgi:putative flippase GtrA